MGEDVGEVTPVVVLARQSRGERGICTSALGRQAERLKKREQVDIVNRESRMEQSRNENEDGSTKINAENKDRTEDRT